MSLPDRLVLDVVTTRDGFDGLRAEWTAAVDSAPRPNVFLTWEWTATGWSHFGRSNALHIVVFRDSDGVAAIAPLQISSIGVGPLRARIVERINSESGDYGGIIVVRRAEDVADALADHLAELLNSPKISAAIVSRVASDDPFLEAWRAATARRSGRLSTEEQRLEGGCYFTDVRHDFKLSKHTKKHKIRQRTRRINEAHDDVQLRYNTGSELERGIDDLLEVHRRRWDGRGDELQGLLAEPARQAFMLDAVRALDECGRVRLLTLVADGRPVAAELDFALGDRIFMFKGAFDPDFGEYSPGQLLHHRVFEDGIAEGIEVFDFGRGEQAYKQRWANGERHLLTTTTVRRGALGRLAGARLRLCRAVAVRAAARGR
jgi:CelD/BcsL family acetyltransferase involved in cellulose biosynthesis